MYVTINPYNMAEVEGIVEVLPGATTKYVVDLIFDSIVFRWGVKIPHTPKKSDSHKIRLAERHLPLVEGYATERHISMTLSANLILNDYFLSRTDTNNPEVAQITPTLPKTEPTQKSHDGDKAKPLRGADFLKFTKFNQDS